MHVKQRVNSERRSFKKKTGIEGNEARNEQKLHPATRRKLAEQSFGRENEP